MSNKGFGNGKATMDNGYGLCLKMLEYKLSDRGKHFIKVDRWFPSSQICYSCGALHPEMKDLTNRTMVCDCGLTTVSYTHLSEVFYVDVSKDRNQAKIL